MNKYKHSSVKTELTRHQESILKMLESVNAPISAQDLYARLRSSRHKIGLATVYRGLDTLKLRGLIQCHTTMDGVSLYSLTNGWHHYLTCLRCGQSISIDFHAIRELEKQLENSLSFTIFYHTLEFFGLCKPCRLQETET